ncbi:hypothetical protein AB3N60_18780 [Leptospira sp. WS39.C2]
MLYFGCENGKELKSVENKIFISDLSSGANYFKNKMTRRYSINYYLKDGNELHYALDSTVLGFEYFPPKKGQYFVIKSFNGGNDYTSVNTFFTGIDNHKDFSRHIKEELNSKYRKNCIEPRQHNDSEHDIR